MPHNVARHFVELLQLTHPPIRLAFLDGIPDGIEPTSRRVQGNRIYIFRWLVERICIAGF